MNLKSLVRVAVESAKNSDVVRGKIGAVAFLKSGHILAKANNVIILGHNHKRTIHGEEYLLYKLKKLKAIERYGRKNINILVVRWIKNSNIIKNARPCSNCLKLLLKSGITFYYSDEWGNIN